MPDNTAEPIITVTLRVRGNGADDYGVAKVVVPFSKIDWSLADGPRGCVGLDDIYQVDLQVGPRTDTWDRA